MRWGRWLSLLGVWFALVIPSAAHSLYQQSQNPQEPASGQQQKKQDKDKKGQPAKSDSGTAQPTNTKTANQPTNEPKPLFGGALNLKSSRQSKDSATLGFNGLDPNGQVQKSFLASAANGADAAKVQQMARTSVSQDELSAFLQEGNLNQQATPPSESK